MLRLTIEVVPWGIESRKRKVGEVEVTNLTGPGPVADYEVRLFTCEGYTRQLILSTVTTMSRKGGSYISTGISGAFRALQALMNKFPYDEAMAKLRWPLRQCGDEAEGEGEETT